MELVPNNKQLNLDSTSSSIFCSSSHTLSSTTFQSSSSLVNTFSSNISTTTAAVNPEAATVHQCTETWLNAIQQMKQSSTCELSSLELLEVEQHILHGITIDVESEPVPIHYNNTHTVNENSDLVNDRISEYIDIGAVRLLPASSPVPTLVQPLHVILKQGKKPRLVIDLSRNLNELLPKVKFHYASVQDAVRLSTHGCYYSKLDISNCFLSFPLHPDSYKYFTFQFNGNYYQFVRLPFGLSIAPRVCTLLLSVVQFVLEQKGLKLVRYLDDFLFVSSSYQLACEHLAIAMSTLQQFGLVINSSKTEGPSQQITFLGIQLHSVDRILSISSERVQEMNELLYKYVSTPASVAVSVKDILSFIGKLSFVSQILTSSRPFMRQLLNAVKGKRLHSRCRLPQGFKVDCVIWLQRINRWNGLISWSIHTQQPFVIISDASISGFGFYLDSFPTNVAYAQLPTALLPGSGVSGTWHSSMSHLLSNRSIAYLELFSVVFALTMLAPVLHNQSVLILTDNSSNVPIINKLRTKSNAIIGLLRSLAELSATNVFACSARHISGESNVLADFLSRPALHMNQRIQTWLGYAQSHSQPLSHVTVVCSSSLQLPNPTPELIQPLHALNVQLNYLPSLIHFNPCLFESVPKNPINHINEPSFDSVK